MVLVPVHRQEGIGQRGHLGGKVLHRMDNQHSMDSRDWTVELPTTTVTSTTIIYC